MPAELERKAGENRFRLATLTRPRSLHDRCYVLARVAYNNGRASACGHSHQRDSILSPPERTT
jgi:hypothetical protein